jgi:hypothetical protein
VRLQSRRDAPICGVSVQRPTFGREVPSVRQSRWRRPLTGTPASAIRWRRCVALQSYRLRWWGPAVSCRVAGPARCPSVVPPCNRRASQHGERCTLGPVTSWPLGAWPRGTWQGPAQVALQSEAPRDSRIRGASGSARCEVSTAPHPGRVTARIRPRSPRRGSAPSLLLTQRDGAHSFVPTCGRLLRPPS